MRMRKAAFVIQNERNKDMDPACNELSLTEAVRAIQECSVTSESLVQACLDRIRERETTVGAWIHFDEEKALEQARKCDVVDLWAQQPRNMLFLGALWPQQTQTCCVGLFRL